MRKTIATATTALLLCSLICSCSAPAPAPTSTAQEEAPAAPSEPETAAPTQAKTTSDQPNQTTSDPILITELSRAALESYYIVPGEKNTQRLLNIDHPSFTERMLYDINERKVAEPVSVTSLPVSWEAGHLLENETVGRKRYTYKYYNGNGYPFGLNREAAYYSELGDADSDAYRAYAEKIMRAHPEYLELNWCQLKYASEDSEKLYLQRYLYKVEGTRLILTPVAFDLFDHETGEILYEPEKPTEEFAFSFEGQNLVLSRDGSAASMALFYQEMGKTSENYWMNHYTGGVLRAGSSPYCNIVSFQLAQKDSVNRSTITSIKVVFADGSSINSDCASGTIYGNHLHLKWKQRMGGKADGYKAIEEPGEIDCQFIELGSAGSGVVGFDRGIALIADGKIYLYNSACDDYFAQKVMNSLPEDARELTDSQVEELSSDQDEVTGLLTQAFADAGIAVNINPATGVLTFDTDILFERGSADLSEDAKAFLSSVITVYTSVLEDAVERKLVSGLAVDGYADSNGTYNYNLELSQQRAEEVQRYCISQAPQLEPLLVATGHSYDNLILKENGDIDLDASRRVEFRFLLNIDK